LIYQIFPERFAIGKPNDIQTKLAQPAYQRDGYSGTRAGTRSPPAAATFSAATYAA